MSQAEGTAWPGALGRATAVAECTEDVVRMRYEIDSVEPGKLRLSLCPPCVYSDPGQGALPPGF